MNFKAKPQTKAGCFTEGFAYGGADILTAGWHNIQASAEDCQTSCQVNNWPNLLQGKRYKLNVILIIEFKVTKTNSLCLLQAITDCLFFTYFETGASQGYCELKFEAGGIPVAGAVSGPRVC